MEKKTKATESDKKWLRSLYGVTNILKRYFEGHLSKDEEQTVERQLQSLDRMTDAVNLDLTEEQLSKSDSAIKKQVFYKLNLTNPTGNEEKATPAVAPKTPFTVPFRKYAAVAAVFVLVFGLSYFMLFNEHSFIKNNFAQSEPHKTILLQTGAELKEIVLPDGTKLYANANTRVDYDKDQFNRRQREIWLEGEAFFEVAKNPEKPFIIHSGNLQTTVKGTSFNVKAYKEIGEINVSVRSGKVEVGTEDETFGLLTANKQLSYNEKTAKRTIAESNWEDAAAWKDHRLVLKNATIAELKLRIKQLYNIDIAVEGNILDNETFGLSFQQNTEFTDVMTVLEQLYDIKYCKTNTGQFSIYRH